MSPPKLQLQISIPPLFCCPISLELMQDPVTLCTGLTYDRPSIEQWFEQGHNTCPASMQELHTQELIPNHTLRRLIQDWCVANRSKGIERIPTPKLPLDPEQIRAMLREIAKGIQIGSNLRKMKNLAKESQKNRKIMVSVGTAQAMAELLGRYGSERSGLEELEICEGAIAVLLLVPAEASEKVGLVRDKQLSSLSWILSRGSCEGKINTAKLLSAIAMDDKHKSSIGSTQNLISGLAGLLRYNLYHKALNAGLVALQNICTNPFNRLKAVEAGAIPLLLDLLLDSSKRNIEASLAILENLCRCAEGRMEVANHALAMAVLVKTILAVSDLATDSVVNILWAVCNANQCKFVLKSAVQAGAFTPTLFGLYIDELDSWMKQRCLHGMELGGYLIQLLIYADDVVLISSTKQGLQGLLDNLQLFCNEKLMTVNLAKTKVMIVGTVDRPVFTYKNQHIETVAHYKYLGLEFESRYSWAVCLDKRIAGGKKAVYSMLTKCWSADLTSWSLKKTLFKVLVQTVILYGCPIWGPCLSSRQWKRVESVLKLFLTDELGVKSQTPYAIMLAETAMLPLEVEALCQTINYVNRVRLQPECRPSRIAYEFNSEWKENLLKWAASWGVTQENWPDSEIGVRDLVQELAINRLWHSKGSRMQKYIEDINQLVMYTEPDYLLSNISRHMKHVVARYRTSSHRLMSETGRWSGIPRESRLCSFCTLGVVEDEGHVLLECPEYSHIRDRHNINLVHLHGIFEMEPYNLGRYIKDIDSHRSFLLSL